MDTANSSDDLNATAVVPTYTDAQIQAAYYVVVVIYPILLAIGTIGNVLNLIVLWRMKNPSGTRIYLTFVAVTDVILLWLFLWPYILSLPSSVVYNLSVENGTLLPYLDAYFKADGVRRWGFEASLQISDWTLLVFSGERLLKSIKPLYFRDRLSAKSALIAEVIVVLLCGLFTVFIPVEAYYCLPVYSYNVDQCDHDVPWLANWKSMQLDAEIGVVIFKFVGLLLLNSALGFSLHLAQKSQASHARIKTLASLRKVYMKSNLILFASTALYLVTQLPTLVTKILTLYYPTYFPESSQQFANPFVQIAFLTNYALNFFLYFAVSKRFRDELLNLFGCLRHSLIKAHAKGSKLSFMIPMTLTTGITSGGSQTTLVGEMGATSPVAGRQHLESISERRDSSMPEDSPPGTPEPPDPQSARMKQPRFSIGPI